MVSAQPMNRRSFLIQSAALALAGSAPLSAFAEPARARAQILGEYDRKKRHKHDGHRETVPDQRLVGWPDLGDRIARVALLTTLFCIVAFMNLALLLGDSYVSLVICSAFMGLTVGAITPAFLALLADRFGPASFGTANGNITFVMAVLAACAVRYSGEVFDRTGGYDVMFYSFIAIAAGSAFLMLTVRRGATSPTLATAS